MQFVEKFSQMPLDLATDSPHKTETLDVIHELARQAEVCYHDH